MEFNTSRNEIRKNFINDEKLKTVHDGDNLHIHRSLQYGQEHKEV